MSRSMPVLDVDVDPGIFNSKLQTESFLLHKVLNNYVNFQDTNQTSPGSQFHFGSACWERKYLPKASSRLVLPLMKLFLCFSKK